MTGEEARAHVGDRVVYAPPGVSGEPWQKGTITGANGRFVFVRYDGDWYGKATSPEALTLTGEAGLPLTDVPVYTEGSRSNS